MPRRGSLLRASHCSKGHNRQRDEQQCSTSPITAGPASRGAVKREHDSSPRFPDQAGEPFSGGVSHQRNSITPWRDVWHHVRTIISNEAEQPPLHLDHNDQQWELTPPIRTLIDVTQTAVSLVEPSLYLPPQLHSQSHLKLKIPQTVQENSSFEFGGNEKMW